MNDLLGTLAAIFYIAFFFFVFKYISYLLYKRKLKNLERYKKETQGISYYLFHQGKEVCIIGSEHKMIRSQLEKIVPLYQNESKVISFCEGLSRSSSEYAHSIDGKIIFMSNRIKTIEEYQELSIK